MAWRLTQLLEAGALSARALGGTVRSAAMLACASSLLVGAAACEPTAAGDTSLAAATRKAPTTVQVTPDDPAPPPTAPDEPSALIADDDSEGKSGAPSPPNLVPYSDPAVALAGVRDIVPDGAPAQTGANLPALRSSFDDVCGPTAAVPPRPPHNLLRWSFDADKGFPEQGWDVYRCCGVDSAPPSGDPSWVKLNQMRVRPPSTWAEGYDFVTGVGTFPDGRAMMGPRLTLDEWYTYCALLSDVGMVTGACATNPNPIPEDPDLSIEDVDPMAMLMLGSLQPEIATMLGLYWVDDNGDGPDCFYRVEGFWDDTGMDSSVTGPVVPALLPAPTGLSLEQTPPAGGLTCVALGGPANQYVGELDPQVLMTWDIPPPNLWTPPGEMPVVYNVCRQAPGDPTHFQINKEYYDFGSGPEPIEVPVAVPRVPVYDSEGEPVPDGQGGFQTQLPDPFTFDDLSANPQYGATYSYRVTGVDLFGRESPPSAPNTISLVDPLGPPAPTNLRAESESVDPFTTPPTSVVSLTFDWTRVHRDAAPDTVYFQVYRRPDSGDLESGMHGCPVTPPNDPANWTPVGGTLAIASPQATYHDGSFPYTFPNLPPPPDDEILAAVLPVERFGLQDTLTLGSGQAVQHFFYRVVAYDAMGNEGATSGAARGHVVDNAPSQPPDNLYPLFSRSEWDETVHVHLTWASSPSSNIKGYKVFRSARTPTCDCAQGTTCSQCPKVCDSDGNCQAMICDSGFCGGSDLGPTGNRQEDREVMLTNGVEAYNSTSALATRPKLRSLAQLGNLFTRDPTTGAPVVAAPSCGVGTGSSAACDSELDAAIGPGNTQYSMDALPEVASGQVYFYRVMAVSEAGITEDENSSTYSPAVDIQIPDFVPPSPPGLASVLAVQPDVSDPGSYEAVDVSWPANGEADVRTGQGGYSVWRADVGQTPTAVNTPNDGDFTPTGLTPGSCYRFVVKPAATSVTLVPQGSTVATVVMTGDDPGGVEWTPPSGVTDVIISRYEGAFTRLNASAIIQASSTPQTIDGLTVTTAHVSDAIPAFTARDVPPDAGNPYCYALKAEDAAGNASDFSAVVLGTSVDTVPPEHPVDLAVARVGGEGTLTFTHPDMGSELRVTIKRSSSGSGGPWMTLISDATAAEVADAATYSTLPQVFDWWDDGGTYRFRYRDLGAALGREYTYRVALRDEAGNQSNLTEAAASVTLGEND